MCVPVLHPFLGFTFRRVFRRLDIALLQTLRCERVRLLYILISISLFLSLSLFLVPACLSLLFYSLSHIYRRSVPSYTCTSFLCPLSLPPPLPSCSHRENLSLLLSRPFFSTLSLSLHPSFFVPLLISLDRIDLFTCTAAITISSPGLFFVRSFLRSLKTN